MSDMRSEDFARRNAIAARIHKKRHKGWNCEDMHPVVHQAHLKGFAKAAELIVEKEKKHLWMGTTIT